MKLDMHCHTHEGSVDSKIGVEEYIRILIEKGYDGMLITDHDTYNGYRYWKEHLKGKKYKDFVVLKGIEYDTNNAGHMLVVMPENVKLRILEMRGMPLPMLLFIVHAFGGIVGPAHPFGEKYLSFTNTRYFRKNRNIVDKFDFIETFNSCENAERNIQARQLANIYGKPGFGGSDSHKTNCIGTAYTRLPETVTKESELISLVKANAPITYGGSIYNKTTKDKIGKVNDVLIYSFWVYNKILGLSQVMRRRGQSRYLNLSKEKKEYFFKSGGPVLPELESNIKKAEV